MYKDLLGFKENTKLVEYESTFPKENQVNLIVPNITTKFTLRNDLMFKRISRECSEIVNNVPGNSMIFFPSYDILNKVYNDFSILCNKRMFIEDSSFNKSEKEETIQEFKNYY
jgi:DNA excision repair protein ERCC-2